MIEDNKVVGIKAVDNLLAAQPKTNYTTTTALTGTIIIDVNCNVDEFELYNEYSKKYPNLVIEYTDKVTGLDPAVELIFKANESANAAIHYRVLGSGKADGASIGTLISTNGPTGIAMIAPSKSDTSKNTYTFTGYWIDTLGNKYYVDGLENADATAKNFNNVIPTTNMTFYPEFIEEVKKHELKFFDYNGNVILQNGKETFGVPYGSTYREANGPLTNFYYLDSSDLLDDERYGFVCWTTAKYKVGEGKNVTPFDLENSVVEKALNLYPYYVKENVREVPSNLEYFNINKQTGVISLNSIYKNTFKGKLTIPDIEGITKVSSFESIDGLTHVYFEKGGPKYTIIQMATFFNCNNLTTVELPESITELGNQSFYSCDNLTTINLSDKITRIGS